MFPSKSYNVSPNAGDNGSTEVPVGSVLMYSSSVIPAGWLPCNGSTYSATAYPDLFKVIGTTFGGSGATFAVPDMRFKTARGSTLAIPVGTTGGTDSVALVINNLPPHSHTLWKGGIQAQSGSGAPAAGDPNVDSGLAGGGAIYQATDVPSTGTRTQVVAQNGTGQTAVNVANPYVVLQYIIKY